MWASGHNGDIRRGYEPTREAAMEACAKSWRASSHQRLLGHAKIAVPGIAQPIASLYAQVNDLLLRPEGDTPSSPPNARSVARPGHSLQGKDSGVVESIHA
jgi:hypothetical protein